MRSAARLVRDRVRHLDFIDAGELVDEFARSIKAELDYRQEATNADAFRRNFARDEKVVVPRVWQHVHDAARPDARAARRPPYP